MIMKLILNFIYGGLNSKHLKTTSFIITFS